MPRGHSNVVWATGALMLLAQSGSSHCADGLQQVMWEHYINVCERPQPRVTHRGLKICTWAWSRECRCPRKSLLTVTRIHTKAQRTLCQLLNRPCPLCDQPGRDACVWTEVITTGVRFYRHGQSARHDQPRSHRIRFRWAPVTDPDPALDTGVHAGCNS